MEAGDRFQLINDVVLSPEWDDGAAFFVPATADTLAVSPLAAALVATLRDTAAGMTFGDLLAALAADQEGDPAERDELTPAVTQVLVQFERLGLIGRMTA